MSTSELLSRRLAGLATTAEAEALHQRLGADRAQAESCASELEMHALLGAVLGGPAADAVAQRVIAALPAERMSRRVAGRLRLRRRQVMVRRWWTALAAVLLVGLGLGWYLYAPPAVARLQAGTGDVWVDGRRAQVGDAIRSGARLSAPLTLDLPDASRLGLRSGTALLTMSGSGAVDLELAHGEADAEVAPRRSTAPLSISTPLACASALGTRFSVSHHGALTRLLVSDGRVLLHRRGDGLEREIGAGLGAELQAGGEPVVATIAAWAGPRVWLRADRGISADAGRLRAWRDLGPLGLTILNDLGQYQPDVLDDAGDGLPAVAMRRYDHMLWCPQGSPFAASPALTVVAWVRPAEDHGERIGTLIGCSQGRGEVGWSFGLRAGRLALEVRDDAHGMELAARGPEIAIGSWQMVGVRLGDGQAAFIADRRLVAAEGPTMPLPGALAAELGLTIGVGSMDQGSVYAGELRELRVYDRALGDEELRAIATQGSAVGRP